MTAVIMRTVPANASMLCRCIVGLLSIVALVMAAPAPSFAEWPERAVKVIVTFPAGSANDAAARIFADALARKWNKPVVVENKPGAEGTIGVAAFVASRDDHALLYTVTGSIAVAPLLVEKLPYNADEDLKPVAATTSIVLTLAVSNSLAINSIAELIEIVRSNPGRYVWASGPSIPRYAFAAFLKRNSLQMTFLGYRDAAQPQADLGEGRIHALLTSLTASRAPVETGKARFIAVANPSRAAILPEVPTVRELGHPELEIDGMAGFFVTKAMPDALREKIRADLAAVCQESDVRRRLEGGGHVVLSCTTGELSARIEWMRQWIHETGKVIDIRNPQ